MALEVGIKITAETTLGEIKTALDAVEKLNKATAASGEAATKAGKDVSGLSEKTKALTNEKLGLSRALGNVATGFSGLGPAGQAASNALLAVASGAGVAGAAVGAISTALLLTVQHFQEARRKKEEFDAAMRTGNVAFFIAQIAAADQALLELENRMDETRRKLAESRAAGVRGDGFLESLLSGLKGEASRVGGERESAVGEQQKILDGRVRQTTLALEFQRAAVGANIREQEELAHQYRVSVALQGDLGNSSRAAKDAYFAESAALRDKNVAERQRKEAEEASKRSSAELAAAQKQRQESEASVMRAMLQSEQALRLQVIALSEGEEAAAKARIEIEAQAVALQLGAEAAAVFKEKQTRLVDELYRLKRATEEAAHAQALFDAEQERRREIQQEDLDYLQKRNALEQRARDFELQKLQISGASEETIIRRQIELLREQKRTLETSGAPLQPGAIESVNQQIELAELRLQRLGQVSINVGKSIADTITDIAQGVATGTLRGFDVLRAAGASMLNLVADIFRQTLQQKLSFELTLATNVRGLPAQLNSAFASGAASLPGGSFLEAIFGGGSSGGGGFSFGGLRDIGGMFNFGGSAPAWTSGFDIADAGGFLGATSSPGIGLGGWLGILGGAFNIINSFARGNIGGGIGGTLGGGVGALFGGPVGFGIGSLLGSLVGGLFQSTPNPTVRVRAQVEGFIYDALANEFKFGNISTRASGSDISGSMVKQVKSEVQSILEQQSRTWTDLLNLFPSIVHDKMIPALENANKLLDQQFARLKFSEGGSRTIAQELAHLGARGAPGKFFLSSRGVIGAGLRESFARAGLGGADSFGDLIGEAFAELPADLGKINLNKFKAGGLTVPKKQEDVAAFVEALKGFVGTAGGLAGISPRGVTPFLSDADISTLESSIAGVLGVTDGNQFAGAVEQMQERIQPVLDFLNQSLQQTADVFGRGMIAALEAANASDAKNAFMQSLGVGIKDTIFQGITESFLASAQFNDLLAPIQKTIREFTEQAIATGQTPSIEAFRRAILPGIDQIQERAEALGPLIEEFQRLGTNIQDLLGMKRVLDVIDNSLQQTADVFGRGMIAALEAANASDAKAAFMQSLGVGIKDTIFQGITESFLASAQFNDLLAPIQKTIREFTEQAIATGATPDIEAFRRAILPGIDQIQDRAETLAPLIELLNEVGIDLRGLLGLLANQQPGGTNITINIDQFLGGETDMNNLVRRIDDLLRAQNPPS